MRTFQNGNFPREMRGGFEFGIDELFRLDVVDGRSFKNRWKSDEGDELLWTFLTEEVLRTGGKVMKETNCSGSGNLEGISIGLIQEGILSRDLISWEAP